MQKGQGLIFIIVGILVIGLIAGGIYYLGKNSSNPQKKVACTDDAKICPDGSAVGRVDPNCEFAACPTPKIQESSPIPSPSSNPASQECEPCGEQGIHNLYGRQCAQGLECKNKECNDKGECLYSSTSFCLKPGQSIKICSGE